VPHAGPCTSPRRAPRRAPTWHTRRAAARCPRSPSTAIRVHPNLLSRKAEMYIVCFPRGLTRPGGCRCALSYGRDHHLMADYRRSAAQMVDPVCTPVKIHDTFRYQGEFVLLCLWRYHRTACRPPQAMAGSIAKNSFTEKTARAINYLTATS
jgi:hypothetical protein